MPTGMSSWLAGSSLCRYDCQPAPLGALRLALAPHYLVCCRAFVVSLTGAWSGRSPRPRQGLWSPGPPCPGVWQGHRGRSHVPEFPLRVHAPFSDPGGVLGTRPDALWTAAFRPLDTVGFLLPAALRNILLSTTILLSGLHHAACPLMPSSSILPWLGVHVEVTTDLLARR